ncbi:hypothetical protein E2C01_082313 [Portunus trituberculatus]|uniref:Uncharacterized protein n=1 Tax=Portunus trituberculatus TaxID=210409 RepID=A0A5B7IPL1_PORTR|nr:hypothetical protein [Portunus trituberculatus]
MGVEGAAESQPPARVSPEGLLKLPQESVHCSGARGGEDALWEGEESQVVMGMASQHPFLH